LILYDHVYGLVTDNKEIHKSYGVGPNTKLTMIRKFDEGKVEYTGNYDFDDLKHWIFD